MNDKLQGEKSFTADLQSKFLTEIDSAQIAEFLTNFL